MNTLYQCEFCGEVDLIKKYIEKHEKECTRNPNLNIRECDNCNHSSITTQNGELSNIKCNKGISVFDMNADECGLWQIED